MSDHDQSPADEISATPWQVRSDQRCRRLVASGEIDVDAVPALDEAWASICQGANTVIDFSAVTFFSAAGVGRLVSWLGRSGASALLVTSPAVDRLLSLCALDDLRCATGGERPMTGIS